MVRFLMILCLVLSPASVPTTQHNFARWEKEIAAYEQADRDHPPAKGAILFTGASSIRRWTTLEKDFPEHQVLNRGFGGSSIIDATHFADRIIFPYEPKMIFLRAGGNDIHGGKSVEEAFDDFKDFVAKVRTKLPDTPIVYISISPAPARWDERDKNKQLNTMIEQYAHATPNVKYIETYDLVLGPDGQPRPELFVADRLHFSPAGYKLLAERVRPYMPPPSPSTLGEGGSSDSPENHLPPHITQLTAFGERADWSHDGKRILFLSKTLGDAMEIDIASKTIHNLTAHYPHHGYTRALYLKNGDILLSGPAEFDVTKPHDARVQCWLSVLDKSLTKPAELLGTKCSEGPAVSRKRMHIAWTHVAAQYPEDMKPGTSRMFEADIIYAGQRPKLTNQRIIVDSSDLTFKCTLETQNFRPPDERELTFSAYGYQGTDACGIDLTTKKVVNYSNAPDQYDEPEGIFPDGQYTLVECDKQNHQGSGHIDLWRLKLDGSRQYERLTYFSDYPGYKASNPVVSDDGRFIAFQLAKSREAAGVGHGIFIYDIEKAPRH